MSERRQCMVGSCPKESHSRGYCNPHYHRLIRYGDPTYSPVTDYTGVDMSLYRVWNAMRQRCTNPNVKSYADYGARGVWVCQAWMTSYKAFRQDMGARPKGMSLDRGDNEGGYTCGKCDECICKGWKANVAWATRVQQANNTRANRRITILGATFTLSEWARLTGNRASMIADRIYQGWDETDAVLKPKSKRYQVKGR